eukprot:TRINITY_DN2994_c0_g1_i1.p1 TRINITY_DN2994_c0_g1~~TRINITY_DN2994_c0_g1_i1.p1  ORF type:complete len:469 (-),score=90.98 TRINITY_DN2994_c0_g1_i1:27-1433(-)
MKLILCPSILVVLLFCFSVPQFVFSSTCPFSGQSIPGAESLFRAHMNKPRPPFRGDDMESMSNALNKVLSGHSFMRLKDCSEFDLDDLFKIQKAIVGSSHPHFQKVYSSKKDRRAMAVNSVEELIEREKNHRELLEEAPHLTAMTRDGRCHETIMWYVHHLTEEAQVELRKKYTLPRLPTKRHLTTKHKRSDRSATATLVKNYDDSLSCVSCHTFQTEHQWPALAGYNNRTGQTVASWPNEFDVEFILEVRTDKGEKGLPDIDNAPGNHFYYKWSEVDPKALNRHNTCPFFKNYPCDIHHRTSGIYIVLNPNTTAQMCCRAFPISVVPPYWTNWGLFLDTNWMQPEKAVADRFIFGEAIQLDEHDYWINIQDNKSMVRFHATLPPPNNHTHGYWHVSSPMNVRPQPDSIFNTMPSNCLPSCGLDVNHEKPIAQHVMPWPAFDKEKIAELFNQYKKLGLDDKNKISVNK